MKKVNEKTFDTWRLEEVICDLDEVCEIWQGKLTDEYKVREDIIELYSQAKTLLEEDDGQQKIITPEVLALGADAMFFSYTRGMLEQFTEFRRKIEKAQITLSDLIKLEPITGQEKTNEKKLKECLVILYDAIYRMRMLIKMHVLIAEASSELKHQDFWGCLQGNVLITTVVIELFSVFENNQIIKTLMNLLKDDGRFDDLKLKIDMWKNTVGEYDSFRHGLAHKTNRYLGSQVDYQKILDLLSSFESYLNNINELVLQSAYEPLTNPCENSLPCLGELKQILAAESYSN